MAKIDKIKNKKMQTYTSLGKAEINELTNARILGTCFIDLVCYGRLFSGLHQALKSALHCHFLTLDEALAF